MRTNFQMLRELDDFTPENRGVLTGKEVNTIASALHLDEMDELALRNMRDFAVVYYARKIDDFEESGKSKEMFNALDVMSAITGVIDSRLVRIGAEV